MSKSITVSYSFRDVPSEIQLNYTIQMSGNVQTIACAIIGSQFPNWLQLRKFEMLSQKEQNVYVPLFSEVNNYKNLDTVLFIDKVYADIMHAEKMKVRVFVN